MTTITTNQLIDFLRNAAGVDLSPVDVGPVHDGGVFPATLEYEANSVPRHGLIPKWADVLLDTALDLGPSDNGEYCRRAVVSLVTITGEPAAAAFDIKYPSYCDEKCNGGGSITVHWWPDVAERDALVETHRCEALRYFLDPVVSGKAKQWLGRHDDQHGTLVSAMAAAVDSNHRIAWLRALSDAAGTQVTRETVAQLLALSPMLATISPERDIENDGDGGSCLGLSAIVVTLTNGHAAHMSSSEDQDYAFQLANYHFRDHIHEKGGRVDSIDWDDKSHQEEFHLWLDAQIGTRDFPTFWSLVWSLIKSDTDWQSFSFRDVEAPPKDAACAD